MNPIMEKMKAGKVVVGMTIAEMMRQMMGQAD